MQKNNGAQERIPRAASNHSHRECMESRRKPCMESATRCGMKSIPKELQSLPGYSPLAKICAWRKCGPDSDDSSYRFGFKDSLNILLWRVFCTCVVVGAGPKVGVAAPGNPVFLLK